MLVMRTTECPADPVGEFVSTEHSVELHHPALAVYPFGFYGVQPRALLGQEAAHDPHPLSARFDPAVVLAEPAPHLFGDMPAGVVPDEKQNPLANGFELLATPRKELRRYRTYRPPVHESQPSVLEFGQVESVTRDGLRVGVVFG